MRKPIVTFKQFDVVIVPFPFTDTANQKRRPALVISDHSVFNATMGRSIMAMITTASHSPWALDINILDLPSAGLTHPSVIRMKLFTLDDVLVTKRVGALSQVDREATQRVIAKLFRINR
jgi:mRNA interferase MazF